MRAKRCVLSDDDGCQGERSIYSKNNLRTRIRLRTDPGRTGQARQGMEWDRNHRHLLGWEACVGLGGRLTSFHQIATTTVLHLVINALRPTHFCNIILYQPPLSRSSRIDSLSPRRLHASLSTIAHSHPAHLPNAVAQITVLDLVLLPTHSH